MLELWGMRSTPSLLSLSDPLWPGVVAPDRILSMGQIELNYVFMLNWIVGKRTTLKFKLRTCTKLNCMKWNWIELNITVFNIESVHMLNWIVWNRTVLIFSCAWTKQILILNWIVWNRTVWLNWIAWNRNVLTIKLCSYAKQNCLN